MAGQEEEEDAFKEAAAGTNKKAGGSKSKSTSKNSSTKSSKQQQAQAAGGGSKRQIKRQQEKQKALLELQQVKQEQRQSPAQNENGQVVSPRTQKKKQTAKVVVPPVDGWRQWDVIKEGVSGMTVTDDYERRDISRACCVLPVSIKCYAQAHIEFLWGVDGWFKAVVGKNKGKQWWQVHFEDLSKYQVDLGPKHKGAQFVFLRPCSVLLCLAVRSLRVFRFLFDLTR